MTETSFANPAHDAANLFRRMLDTMARPGLILPFEPPLDPPEGLSRELAGVVLTLCDFQTPLWLGQGLRTAEVERYLRLHTGAPLVDDPAEAAYALARAECELPVLSRLPMGSDEYPDRSATLIIEVTALRDIDGIAELSGPGIETIRRLEAPPLGLSFWTDLMELHQDYPLGVDVILMAPGAIAAVPRSTRITIREAL